VEKDGGAPKTLPGAAVTHPRPFTFRDVLLEEDAKKWGDLTKRLDGKGSAS
jgi:hypothetical protein